MNLFGLIIVAMGIFSICGAAFDWDWFINHRKAQFFVAIFGRNGARVFYGILGVFLVVLGALVTFGIVQDSS
jgi:hypothetical protein